MLESENGEIVIKDSEFIKVSEDVIYVLPEKNADEVYKNAVSGTVICDKNGNEIKSNASLYSGMKVYLKNGEGSIDEKILIIPCDADGDGAVSASDARIALRNSVGLDEFEPWQTAAADMVNPEDKEVASDDARYILRASVGLEDISEWIKA